MADELHPINAALSPVQVGEVVAFTETHPEHGSVGAEVTTDEEGRAAPLATEDAHAKYGKVHAIGLDSDGNLCLDLIVFDPATGLETLDEGEPETYRAKLEEIQ